MLARYGNGSVSRVRSLSSYREILSTLEIRYLSLKPRPSCKVLNSDNLTILSATTEKLQCNTFERRNQCTSGGADDWQCREPLDVCEYIWRRISVSNHDCRYRRYPGPRYSRASRRTGSYWLSARTYINYRPPPMRYRTESHQRSCEYRPYVTGARENCHRGTLYYFESTAQKEDTNEKFISFQWNYFRNMESV